MRPPPVLLAGLLIGGVATTSLAVEQQSTCTYDDPSKTVTLTAPDAGLTAFVVLTAEAGVIMFQEIDFRTFEFGPKQTCGTATTSNTDLIRATGGGASGLILVMDETFGPFAPGFTVEPTGVSEIEVEFQPIGGLLLGGTQTPVLVRLGTLGANVNGDDDVDVTFTASPVGFGYFGGAGNDDIAATGGLGTGDVATIEFAAGGGDGSDLLAAGGARASLDGQAGNDVLTGGLAGDFLGGGAGNDRLDGGPGGDTLEGDAGNDRLTGGPSRDRLGGGRGRDRCVGGPGRDFVKGCES